MLVGPSNSCTINVTYSPTATGLSTGLLNTGGPTANLRGTGVSPSSGPVIGQGVAASQPPQSGKKSGKKKCGKKKGKGGKKGGK